jgi:hypothetical protein
MCVSFIDNNSKRKYEFGIELETNFLGSKYRKKATTSCKTFSSVADKGNYKLSTSANSAKHNTHTTQMYRNIRSADSAVVKCVFVVNRSSIHEDFRCIHR